MKYFICCLVIATIFVNIKSQKCVNDPYCGDGIVGMNEECDDGNHVANDGCYNCSIECGYTCSSLWGPVCNVSRMAYENFSLHSSACEAVHGDGKRVSNESCDDGNLEGGDGCICTASGNSCTGSCVVEKRWTCSTRTMSPCESKLVIPDKCSCVGNVVDIHYCDMTISSVDGYSGSSKRVQCKACSRNHYGDCTGPESYCLWNETCNSQGFCSKDGSCICFGNFSGPHCNRCKKDHYGANCSTFCHSTVTCGGLGVCDVNGSCIWNSFCEGALGIAERVGDGRRLGSEECDDGNQFRGDGCSSEGKIELGFICLGGCQPNGDVRRRYGECQLDVCSPVPCGWALIDTGFGDEVALFSITPRFTVKMWQSNPFPGRSNSLTVLLVPNIPVPPCVSITRFFTVQISPVLRQEQSETRCQDVVITISSLLGASSNNSRILLKSGNSKIAKDGRTYFRGLEGRWNDANKSLILTVQKKIERNESILFVFDVINSERAQQSPKILIETQGIETPPSPVDKDTISTPSTANTIAGDAEPLKIRSAPFARVLIAQPGNAGRHLLGTEIQYFLSGSIRQSSSDLGSINTITISFTLAVSLSEDSRITVAGLLPSRSLLMFARTSSTRCAQNLPFGPLPLNASSPYFSTVHKNIRHSAFVQRLFDNNSLQFEIFWSFPSIRTLKERFQYARNQGEPVVWFIKTPGGVDMMKKGTWWFSRKMGDPFDAGVGQGFSLDDGAWGAASGVVDGSIETARNNPAISCSDSQSTCTADFWGQGNFNQQEDVGCVTNTCCEVYFTGTGVGNSTKSMSIRNELYLVPCPTCICTSAGACGEQVDTNLTTISVSPNQDSCSINQSQGWMQGFNSSLVYSLGRGHSVGIDYSLSFVLRNPLSPRSASSVSLSASGTQSWIILSNSTSLMIDSPSVIRSGINQSSSFPGALNAVTVSFTLNFPLIAFTSIILRGLLPRATLFMTWTDATCSGSQMDNTDNSVHSYFRQDLYDGNILKFQIFWSFSSSKTLSARIKSAEEVGEPVVWRILWNGTEYLRSGTWKVAKGSGAVSPFIWGAASGIYGDNPSLNRFWGQDNTTGCGQYYLDGNVVKSSFIRDEIYSMETALLYKVYPETYSMQAFQNGDIALTANTLITARQPQILQLMFQNQLVARGAANVTMSVAGCNSIESRNLLPPVVGDGQPLRVQSPAFLVARMGQSNPYPAAVNNVSVTLAANVLLDANINAFIEISNLLGARAESGPLKLMSEDGNSHLYFSASIGSLSGYGLWDDAIKTLTLFVSKPIEPANQIMFSFVIENPRNSQTAPDVTVSASTGVQFLSAVPKNSNTVEIVNISGSATVLFVLCPSWVNVNISQSTPFPAALNSITVVWSTNVAIRPSARSYSAFMITVSGFHNASAESGATAIVSSCPSCFNAVWDNTFKELKLRALTNLNPVQSYTVSFNVTNPSVGQKPPTLAIASSGVVMATNTTCNDFNARVLSPAETQATPLAVTFAQFITKKIGQSNPYPGGQNVLTLTISTNVPLLVKSRTIVNTTFLNISGLRGAVFDKTVSMYANFPYMAENVSTSTGLFSPALDEVSSGSLSIILNVLRDTQDLIDYTLKFNITNQIRGQESPIILISCVGIRIPAVTMESDNSSILSDLPGTVIGDAAPLKIYNPLFRLKSIGQSNPFPAAVNVLSVTFSVNVNLRKSSILYSSWAIVISNLIGGPATSGDISLGPNASAASFASTEFGKIGYARWSGSAQVGGQLVINLADDILANRVYFFNFNISNPAFGQMSPEVGIEGVVRNQESLIEKVWMDRDNSSLLSIFERKVGDAMPLQIRSAAWILKTMSQSTPYPGALNTLTATFSVNVPIFSLLNTTGSVGTPCSTRFEGSEIAGCDEALIARSCLRTIVTISGLSGAIVPNCSESCVLPAHTPCGWKWNSNSKSLTFTVTNALRENTSYILSFNVTNPIAGQASPPISIEVSGIPIAARSMDKDMNDRAPLFVYSIQLKVKQISHSSPYPYDINCITVLLQTNLKLSFETIFRMYSFAGMTLVSNGATIQLSDPRCSCLSPDGADLCSVPYFAATSCQIRTCELESTSRAAWDISTNGLVLYVAKEVSANENVTFSFMLRNSGTPPAQLIVYIASQVGGVSFPSVPMDGLLTFLSPRFQVKNIGQSSPYPAARNFITVTLIMNVPIFASAGSIVTISGLRGVSMSIGLVDLLGPELSEAGACWRSCIELPSAVCSGFAADNPSSQLGFVSWTNGTRSISFKILKDVPRNKSMIFRFIVTNPTAQQQSPSVSVAIITGKVPVPYAIMDSDQGIPNQAPLCGENQNFPNVCKDTTRAGDASVLKVRSGDFVFTDLCMVQDNRFLGAINTITVTISTSVPISSGQSTSFYLSGLSGAEISDGAKVLYRSIDCSGNLMNGTWATTKWRSEKETFYFELTVDTVAFWKYVVSFDVVNPIVPQASPAITLGLEGISFPTVQPCKDKRNPPLLVESPRLIAKVCQSTALPGATNNIKVEFSTNVPLSQNLKAKVVVSGFIGLLLECDEASCLELKGKDRYMFSDSFGLVGHGEWNPNYLGFSAWIVNSTVDDEKYELVFTLKNPLVAQDGHAVAVDFFLGSTEYDTDVSYCEGIFYPAYIVENKVLYAGIHGSTNFPGALNQVTFALKMELALDNLITITITGLRGSATFDNLFLPIFCPSCCLADSTPSFCPCPMNTRMCNVSLQEDKCAQDNFNGSAQWNQVGGRLELTPTKVLEAGTQYVLSFHLQNPLYNQDRSPVIVKFSVPNIAAKQVIQEDSEFQFPAVVDGIGFLVLSAGQSSPYPCDINTVSVTLAMNVPLGPGVTVVLSGFSSAKFTCDTRSGRFCNSQTTSSQSVFAPYLSWQSTMPGILNLTIGNKTEMHAGCNYTVSFSFRNPSFGQEAPVPGLIAEVRYISIHPFPNYIYIARTSVKSDDGLKSPLKILKPEFVVREFGASNPNVGAVNIISLTLATNVKLRLDCFVSFTISGLSSSSGDIVQVARPGPNSSDPFQWRSDTCPRPARSFFSISNPVSGQTCSVDFAGTVQGTGSWLAPLKRINSDPCTMIDCFGETYGNKCINASAWDVDETLTTWLQGQRSHLSTASFQHFRHVLPELGGESCDARWNCSEFAYDLGQCVPSGASPSGVLGAGAWNSSSGSLTLYLRNESCPNVNYTIQFQITNPKVFYQSTFLVSAGGLDGLTIPETLLTGTWGSSLVLVPASFVTKSLGQSSPYPGALNVLTLTLATNVPITERMMYYITIIGLKGATKPSGDLPIRDASGKDKKDHLNFRAHATGERGLGKWNNTYKQLTLLVASDLVPNVNYTISFELYNDVSGQSAPVILIGSNKIKCAPNSRPASAAIALMVLHVDGHQLDFCQFDMRSLEDLTYRPGGIWSKSTVLLPPGKWILNFKKAGYHSESLEVDVLLENSQVEISSNALVGTSCDRTSIRSAYQICFWSVRPGLETFLVPIIPKAAWFVLTWDDMSVQLDLWLVAKDTAKVSPWINPNCSIGSIIEGGGVHRDCPKAIIPNSMSKIQIDKNVSRSYNQVVLSLFDVPTGEYHVYVNVVSANPVFSGTERGRAYLPDGSSTNVYTSLLRSQDGFWWYSGYFIKGSTGLMSFRVLNYDQLTSDPIPYQAGYLLTIQLVVTDASTGLKITASYYLLQRATDNSTVGKGIVASENPGTVQLKVRNQAYVLIVSCPGYFPKTVNIPFEISSRRSVEVYLMPQAGPSTVRLLLTGIKSQSATKLYVMPCRNSGSWSLNAGTCPIEQALLPPAVYSGCSKAIQGKSSIIVEQPECLIWNSLNECAQWKDGTQGNPTFQSISIVNSPLGDYDVHVRLGPQYGDNSRFEVNIVFQSSKSNVSFIEVFSPIVPADVSSWWWHVGYLKVRSNGVQFTLADLLSSDPTNDGCRITSGSVTKSLNGSQGATITVNAGSGRSIVLNVPPGVWPMSVPSQVTVSLLSDPPRAIPSNATSAGPMIFLDPSGVSFLQPGVTLMLPVTAQLPRTRLMYPTNPFGIVVCIHRLSKSGWIPLQSNIIADSQDNALYVSTVTDSFSAYALLVLPPLASESMQANETSSGNSTRPVSEQSQFPFGAVIGGSIGGVVLILLTAFFLFRHQKGSKFQKQVKVPIPREHMPYQPSSAYAYSQIEAEKKSRMRNSSTPFLPDEEEPLNQELGSHSEGAIMSKTGSSSESLELYMKQHPVDLPGSPSLPPYAIAKLVQQGYLLPSRSSIGLLGTQESVSAQLMHPEKVEPFQELTR